MEDFKELDIKDSLLYRKRALRFQAAYHKYDIINVYGKIAILLLTKITAIVILLQSLHFIAFNNILKWLEYIIKILNEINSLILTFIGFILGVVGIGYITITLKSKNV